MVANDPFPSSLQTYQINFGLGSIHFHTIYHYSLLLFAHNHKSIDADHCVFIYIELNRLKCNFEILISI